MAQSPRYKVYDDEGTYLASVREPDLGAAIIAAFGCAGWTIRDGHSRAVWTEGKDGAASESYDTVQRTALGRIQARARAGRVAAATPQPVVVAEQSTYECGDCGATALGDYPDCEHWRGVTVHAPEGVNTSWRPQIDKTSSGFRCRNCGQDVEHVSSCPAVGPVVGLVEREGVQS